MTKQSQRTTRRAFLTGTGAALGSLAVSSADAAADEGQSPEINAMHPTPEQMQQYIALDHDGPIVMVNLLKFKPDGGAESYAKYGSAVAPLLKKIGARVLFSGKARLCFIGTADWDWVALVEYPSKAALVEMVSSAEYQAIHHDRAAGLEGQVLYAVAQADLDAIN